MILCSTLAKLQARGAHIVRIRWPAITFQGATIPAHIEYFAKAPSGNHTAAAMMRLYESHGHAVPVDTIPASNIDAWTQKPTGQT